jgi:hypothetical protein
MTRAQKLRALELLSGRNLRRLRGAPSSMRVGFAPAYGAIDNPASLPKCWSDELGNELIAQCHQHHPQCNPDRVAALLELPYCSPPDRPVAPLRPEPASCPPADLGSYVVVALVGGLLGAYLTTRITHKRSTRSSL